MGVFEYTAADAKGRLRKGVLEGDTPRQARQTLRDQGLVVVSVEPVVGRPSGGPGRVPLRRGLGTAGLALVTRQLATMIRSGAILGEALRVVAEQTEKSRTRKVMAAVRGRVLEGMSLAAAMGEFPEAFPAIYRATVGAGEKTGRLDLVLERLADYTEFKQQLNQKIVLALAYPILLTVVAVLVVTGLLTYVVPQVVSVFRNIDQQLPLLTRGVIRLSTFLAQYGLVLLLLIVLAVIISRFLLRFAPVRRRVHAFILGVPVIGRFVRSLEVSRFTRTLSMLVSSGVPVLDGMKVAAGVMSNLVLREGVEEAAKGIREGKGISQALAETRRFPPMVIYLIASGESGAELDSMLTQAALSQEKEVEMMAGLAGAVFEPLLILLMGGVVLLIVLAVLMPVFELNQLIR